MLYFLKQYMEINFFFNVCVCGGGGGGGGGGDIAIIVMTFL